MKESAAVGMDIVEIMEYLPAPVSDAASRSA